MTQDDGTVEFIYCGCPVFRGDNVEAIRALAVPWLRVLFEVYYVTYMESPRDPQEKLEYWNETLLKSDEYDFDLHHVDVQSHRLLLLLPETYDRIINPPRRKYRKQKPIFDGPSFLE